MKTLYQIILLGLLIMGCSEKPTNSNDSDSQMVFNQDLETELEKMAEIDQIAVFIPQGKYKDLSQEEWKLFRDSVFTTHQVRLEEIFEKYGYPGYDLVGQKGSKNFWLMVQHADDYIEFQKQVLEKMKIEVERENADPGDYGYLVDRVNVNSGKPQIYGSQVAFNTEICQSYPLELEDSINVNKRRNEIGLKPLEVYLNEITEMHFELNKETYLSKGVEGPKLYEIKQAPEGNHKN